MLGEERRKQLLELIEKNPVPITGTELAKHFQVSRQIIVQDIALLRATNKNILSTNKGYVIFQNNFEKTKFRRTFRVKHRDEEILQEFNCIIDSGAKVLDVTVEHELYGQISVDLRISSRQDACKFVEQIKNCEDKSLNTLTKGIHYHTIEADSEEILNEVENSLRNAGFLAE